MLVPGKLRVDVQLNQVWTNISDHVLTEETIQIQRGRTSETASPTAASATLTLFNPDGRFTPRNPVGLYYPYFTRNTPIRIGVGVPPQGAGQGQQAAGTSVVAPATVAESAGLALAVWAQTSVTATITVGAGYTAATSQTGHFVTSRTGRLAVGGAGAVAASTASSTQTGTSAGAQVFIPGGTFSSVDVAQVVANYSSEFFPPSTGPYNLAAGDVLVVCAVWSDDRANAMVCPPLDDSGDSEWQCVADSGPTTIGSPRCVIWTRYANKANAALTVKFPNWLIGYSDTQISVYKVTGATAWNPRFIGQCSEIVCSGNETGKNVRATVTCGGALRQLGQGNPPAHSSIYRAAVESHLLAYWPLEGGTLSGALPSPIAGVAPATAFGGYAPGNNATAFPLSDQLGTFTAGNVVGHVPVTSTASQVTGGAFGLFQLSVSDGAEQGHAAILSAQVAGAAGAAHWIFIQYTSDTVATLVVFDEAGNTLGTNAVSFTSLIAPAQLLFFMQWLPNPANPTTKVDMQFGVVDAVTGLIYPSSIFTLNTTVGAITNVWLGREPTGGSNFIKPFVAGHLGVTQNVVNLGDTLLYSDMFPTGVSYAMGSGWLGEGQYERMIRLAQEAGVPLAVRSGSTSQGFTTTLDAMGTQLSSTLLDAILTAVNTDCGELFDGRANYGLAYRSVAALSAQTAVSTLDYSARVIAVPLVPSDDDSFTRNDISAQQQLGPAARVTLASGALSTLPVPSGVGTYATSQEVSVYAQARDLANVASWLVHTGTVNEPRFTSVMIPIGANPARAQEFAAIDIGQRIDITNPPAWTVPGPIRQIVIGYREVLAPGRWDLTLACRPYTPFAVAKLDGGDVFARLDSGSSSTTSTVTSGATSFQVTTTLVGDLWGTGNPPFDILVAGERMTVTAITSSVSPQTFTVTRAVNGVAKTHAAGEEVHVYYQAFLGLNGVS